MNCTNFSLICQQSTTVCPTLVSVSFITKAVAYSATAPTLIFPSLRIGFPLLTLIAKTGIVTLGLCECNTSLWKKHRCNIHFGLVIVCVHVLWTGDRLDIQIRHPRESTIFRLRNPSFFHVVLYLEKENNVPWKTFPFASSVSGFRDNFNQHLIEITISEFLPCLEKFHRFTQEWWIVNVFGSYLKLPFSF